MEHTFWHTNLLIGTAALVCPSPGARERAGLFNPTAHGLTLLPRLLGSMTKQRRFEEQLAARGRTDLDIDSPEMDELLRSSPAGRAMFEAMRLIVQIEIRAPDNERVHVAALTFSDIDEMQRIGQKRGVKSLEYLSSLPHDFPKYLVMITPLTDAQRAEREAMLARYEGQRPAPVQFVPGAGPASTVS